MMEKILSALGVIYFFASTVVHADEGKEISAVSKGLLQDAAAFENKNTQANYWQAARLYCEASRLGEIEAQYRLGILYAFGKGVPQNRSYATTLFSIAARQGHHEAANMLDTIHFSAEDLPPCTTVQVDPEKMNFSSTALELTANIDRYVAKLPNHQKWVIDLVNTTSEWYEVDPKLTLSIIAIESNFQKNATSNAHAMGLMQLIPATANRFNVKNAYDAAQNVKGGIRYLKWLIDYYAGDVQLAVAAYNAGEKTVDRYKGVPPYKETKEYVKKFKQFYQAPFHPYTENPSAVSPVTHASSNANSLM